MNARKEGEEGVGHTKASPQDGRQRNARSDSRARERTNRCFLTLLRFRSKVLRPMVAHSMERELFEISSCLYSKYEADSVHSLLLVVIKFALYSG
jgi:hypothetical protein